MTRNNCGIPDQADFAFDYTGTLSNSWTNNNDGKNMVDVGTMPSSCGAADGCTRIRTGLYSPSYGYEIRKCDTLLRAGFVSGRPNNDVQGLSGHEAGHCVGLGDLYSGHNNLTMYGITPPNPSTWDTLGLGDIQGMRYLY